MKKTNKETKVKLTKEEKLALKEEKKANKKHMDPILRNAYIFGLIIIFVLGILFATVFITFKNNNKPTSEPVVQTISALEKYGYNLEDRDSELYKKEFEILKKNLESKNLNYDEYAESIAKLFVIDLYTISNKINKYDVGGAEFVLPEARENFKLKVEDTIYRYVEDNSKGDRDQTLPTVSSVKIITTEKTTYKYNPEIDKTINKEYEAYKIKYSNEYNVSQGYDTEGTIIIVKDNDFLYVVEKQ